MLMVPGERQLRDGDAKRWVAVWRLSGDAKLMEVVPKLWPAPGTRTSTPARLRPHTFLLTHPARPDHHCTEGYVVINWELAVSGLCSSRASTRQPEVGYRAGRQSQFSPGSTTLHPRPQLLEAPASPRAQHAWLVAFAIPSRPLPIRDRQLLQDPCLTQQQQH